MFAVTRRASGADSPITSPAAFKRFTFGPSLEISTASRRIRDIFTSSVGWNCIMPGPTLSHRFLPCEATPRGLNMVRSMVI